MANAALAGQIETRVNAWRHRTPMKGDAVKAIDGWVRDAGIAGESDAAAILRQAVAVAERVGTVKSVAPWDEVIAELDAAVKSLRGTTKADAAAATLQQVKSDLENIIRGGVSRSIATRYLKNDIASLEMAKSQVDDAVAFEIDGAIYRMRLAITEFAGLPPLHGEAALNETRLARSRIRAAINAHANR